MNESQLEIVLCVRKNNLKMSCAPTISADRNYANIAQPAEIFLCVDKIQIHERIAIRDCSVCPESRWDHKETSRWDHKETSRWDHKETCGWGHKETCRWDHRETSRWDHRETSFTQCIANPPLGPQGNAQNFSMWPRGILGVDSIRSQRFFVFS